MPGLGNNFFARGRKLLGLLDKRKEQQGEESPLPPDAEEPPSSFFKLFKAKPKCTDTNNNNDVEPENDQKKCSTQDEGRHTNQRTEIITPTKNEMSAAGSSSKDLSQNAVEFKGGKNIGHSSSQCPSLSSASTIHRSIDQLHEAARTRVYIRGDHSQEAINAKKSTDASPFQQAPNLGTKACHSTTVLEVQLPNPKSVARKLDFSADKLDTSTSEPSPDLAVGDSSTITVLNIQATNTLSVARKLDLSEVPSPNAHASDDPQTAENSHASPAASDRISLLTPPITDTTMIFDAGDLDLGNIFDSVTGDQSVTLDLPVANTAENLEEIPIHHEGDPEEGLPGNVEIAQDNQMMMAREEDRPKQVTRKRARNPTQHKAAEAKRALYAGEAHFNKKGQFRPAPTMRVPCACKFKCSTKITEEERHNIFTLYNCTLGCKDKQWAYIRAHSSTVPVTKTTTHHETPQRKVSRKYFLDVSKENGEVICVQVCKVMFMNTLAIWDGVIDSAYKHVNQQTKTPTPDKRGKHSNRPKKTTAEQMETVKTHINSYPRIPSHYVRSRIQREYVESGLTAAKMFRQYKEWCVSQSIPEKNRASRSQYKHIFNFEFNIGFYRPKKDKCQLCALMKNGTRQEREHFKEAWVSHFKSKKACYAEQKKARELVSKKENCAMLSFDLQKVLPCPKSDTSVFFYKNKLSVYNLTVYESRSHIGTCYLWHEGIAKRGANEIGSCVMKALVHQAKEGKTEIYSFSDSCSGQNKNRYIYGMMLQVSAIFGVKIRHCFLTPGHTYNDADSVHARIESATKEKEIYNLSEWIKEIENAKQNNPAYKVVQMERKDFFDLKELVGKQNWKINTDGHVIKWNKVRIIETDGNRAGVLAYQYEIDGSKYYLDTNQRKGHPVNLKTFKPKVAYPANIPLKAKTIDHLRSLCRSLAIPSKYHPFYENIFANVQPTEDDEEVDALVLEDSCDPEEIVDEDGTLEQSMANAREDGDGEEREDDEEDEEEESDEDGI